MKAHDLILWANDLLVRPRAGTVGLWPRAAALLARQALEMGLQGYFAKHGWKLEGCSTRAQLLCLRELAGTEVARDATYGHNYLSHLCHHHPYELAPLSVELRSTLELVESVLERLESAS